MGLQFRLRLYDRDLVTLQCFSGHARIENLAHYLSEMEPEDALLNVKLDIE